MKQELSRQSRQLNSRRSFIRTTSLAGAALLFTKSFGSPLLPFEFNLAAKVKPLVPDMLTPALSATMNGYIGNKLNLSYNNRVLAQDEDVLIEPFKHRTESRMWQSEFWGKWFTSAVLAYKYQPTPALKQKLDKAVAGLIATQTPDGYIGNYKSENRLEQWDIWGRKYCLLGLLDYYDLTQDAASLQASVKLADHLIKEINDRDGIIVNKGNYRGMAASSVLEPIVRLYSATGDKKYLQFAETIVQQWETPGGPKLISKSSINVGERFEMPASWYSWEQGQKAYEMMSCYEGLLELYRVTGKPAYKEAVEKTWRNIRDTEINIAGSGASEEMWFGGKDKQYQHVAHYQETCVTVTWIKLNQQLLRLTGEARYADEIERAYYNALLGSITADGADWAKYTPLVGERLPGSGQCGMDLNCCVASGPRGQFTLPLTAVMQMPTGVSVNFYVDGKYNLKTPKGSDLQIVQQTTYPVSGQVQIQVKPSKRENMLVKVRIPAWSENTAVAVNGVSVNSIKSGDFVEISRDWSPEDVVTVDLDLRGRVQTIGQQEKYFAITRGPLVLARDMGIGGPNLANVQEPVVKKDGTVDLTVVPQNNASAWLVCTAKFIPESYAEKGAEPVNIPLVDYASAGYDKQKSAFKVWLPKLFSKRRS